ncbi:hypothetical protein N865_17585 [Intrasporangium oryzae NRRL B-24470]|uniref:DUF3105 domain-containing protein n=1 Tax=Intrasporangium oryzae NRRL B-24470 TaxID=1386089 RepID=W9G8K1_9MICO|nr:DUF3105 domain-containing protein [Intrasporangium oryzae]EWT00204.1 hypothetical protein N865_17585 [Intrasporangium oryzae NRRL B-24470]
MARETSRDRREKVAAMQAKQKAAERRRLFVVIGACVAVIAIIAAAVTWAIVGEQNKKNQALDAISGDVAAAACDPITNDPASGSSDHVGPGTNKPDVLRIKYSTVPPSSGQHFATPALDKRRVYTVGDAPAIENLVHNLEHGYTILWYDPSLATTQAASFEALSTKINAMKESAGKFIISPWDPSYGAFPAGKKYALSHWGADVNLQTGVIKNQMGHRQLCGGLNTTVVEDFVKKFPWSAAPEPGAA